jgi:hypothetical protein
MIIFNLFSIPLFYIIFSSLFGSHKIASYIFWRSFLKGLLGFIPVYLVYMLFMNLLKLPFSILNLFLDMWIDQNLIFILLASLSYLLFSGGFSRTGIEKERMENAFAYFAGIFTVLNFMEMINIKQFFDVSFILIKPFFRISLVLVISFFTVRFQLSYKYEKLIYMGGLILTCGILVLGPLFFEIHFFYISLGVTALFFIIPNILSYYIFYR